MQSTFFSINLFLTYILIMGSVSLGGTSAIVKKSGSSVQKTENINIIDFPSNWEIISGKWEFKNNEVTQTNVAEGESCVLKWKGSLPAEPFYVEFEIQTYASTNDTFKPEAYLVVRSDDKGQSGHGFGLHRSGNKQLYWKQFPSDSRIDFAKGRSGKNWGGPWQKFALAVDGPCYEWYYPRDVTKTKLPADLLVLRGYIWEYIKQKTLVLRTNGSRATFRNIRITPLSETPPNRQFKIVAPHLDEEVTSTRPVMKWVPLAENSREDFDYHITIANTESNKVIASDITQEVMYRPAQSLCPGKYHWSVEAKTFYGSVWGGKISGTFIVSEEAKKEFDDLKVTGPYPKHFTQAQPQLVWKWMSGENPVDRVEIYNEETLLMTQKIPGADEVAWKPGKALNDGLNQFTIKLFHKDQLIESVDTFAVRTQIPEMHTFRDDGVLLRNGKTVVPIATYRDPSDTLTRTDGLEEAGFNLTHSYHFEGSHHYNIKKENLEKEFSRDKLNQLIDDARNYLRLCDSKGIKVALSIRRPWVYNQKTELIREYVAALMGEPGLLTWYLYDEPDYIGISAVTIRNAYRTIKNVDPYHPVSLIYAHADLIPRLTRCCDILWSQAYHVQPADTMKHIATQFRAREYSAKFGADFNNPNPLASWAILGVFDQAVYKGKRQHPFSEHSPNPQDIHAQIYAAMIGKARGIVYYWLPHTCYDIRKDTPQIWKAVVNATHQLNTIMPYLLEEGKELKIPSNKEGIVARARKLNDGRIIIVLLNTKMPEQGETLTWQWNIPMKQAKKIAGNGDWKVSNGRLTVTLKPLEGISIMSED